MKRVISSNDIAIKHLHSAIFEKNFPKFNQVEKKIYARACNSTDAQVYLTSAVESLDLVNFEFTSEFTEAFDYLIENYSF